MVLEWFEQGLSLQQGSRAFMTLLGISLSIQTLEYLVVARRDQVMRWDLEWHETRAPKLAAALVAVALSVWQLHHLACSALAAGRVVAGWLAWRLALCAADGHRCVAFVSLAWCIQWRQ